MPSMPTGEITDMRALAGGPSSFYPSTDIPDASAGASANDPNKLYQYAVLSALLGSAGAGLGQAFRPWIRPPQPLPSPQAPQMPITAPAALQALTQTRAARKGF